MELLPQHKELIRDILDYLEDSESIDFEEQCQELGIPPQDLIFNDKCGLENHIYYKCCKLRYLIKEL